MVVVCVCVCVCVCVRAREPRYMHARTHTHTHTHTHTPYLLERGYLGQCTGGSHTRMYQGPKDHAHHLIDAQPEHLSSSKIRSTVKVLRKKKVKH